MHTSILKRGARRALACLGAASLGTGLLIAAGGTSGADPKQFSALVGVGSDTTQDVLNGLSGESNGNTYTPVRSSAASGRKQITSWDAIGTDCITPKAPGATFLRPNGSTNGRRALSRAIDGTNWPASTALCGGPKPVSGLVDFARSSAGPSGTGTALTYIPFGRDALGFAYYANGVTPVTNLTTGQLQSLFSAGPATIGGVEIVPCGIQTGSGTYQSWNEKMAVNQATETAATAVCNAAGTGARVQENDAAGLKAKGDALVGKQVVIGFSAANFISQANGVAASQLASGVDLGTIDALPKPYDGSAPSTTPNATFYASNVWGRDVYNVVASTRIGGLANANLDFKSLFVGSDSAVCQATTTINAFGFATIANCGNTSITGPLVS